MLLEPGCDGSGVLEFAEEALDEVAVAVEPRTNLGTFTRRGMGLMLV